MAELTKTQLRDDIDNYMPDNTRGDISPSDARFVLDNMTDSLRSQVEAVPDGDVAVDSSTLTGHLAGITTLPQALAILDQLSGTGGGGGTGVTGTLRYGISDSATGSIIAESTVDYTVGSSFLLTMPAVTEGQFYVMIAPTGYRVASIIDAAHFEEVRVWSVMDQRYTLGPLNPSNSKTYTVIVLEG